MYSEDLVRVVVRGSFLDAAGGSVAEQFAWGFHLHLDTDGSNEPFDWAEETQGVATGVSDRVTTHFSLATARWAPTVRFDEVRAYHLSTAGLTLDMGQAPIVDVVGTGDVSLPPEVALCVSLYAYPAGVFNPAGGKARGRLYLPAPSRSQIDVGGRLSVAAQTGFSTLMDAFLEDVQGMSRVGTLAGHWDLVVASSVDAGARQVERIRVGRVLDVQRRRRRDLDELYMETPLSHE